MYMCALVSGATFSVRTCMVLNYGAVVSSGPSSKGRRVNLRTRVQNFVISDI